MLGPDGPSLGDLLNVQAQMLQALSKQLAALQNGLVAVLERLDKIEAVLDRLPAEVVREHHVEHVAALVGTYSQIMQAAQLEAAAGITARQALLNNHLKTEVLDKLLDSAAVLLNHPNMTLAPLLAAALRVHVSGMASLYVKTPPPDGHNGPYYEKSYIQALVQRYQAWFEQVLPRAVDRFNVLRKTRADMLAELGGLHETDHSRSKVIDDDFFHGSRCRSTTVEFGEVRYEPRPLNDPHELVSDLRIHPNQYPIREDIQVLLNTGIVTIADLPFWSYAHVIQVWNKKVDVKLAFYPEDKVYGWLPYSSDTALVPTDDKTIYGYFSEAVHNLYEQTADKSDSLEEKLTTGGFEAIVVGSSQMASKNALDSIKVFLPELSKA
jgi:hypothetical protein